MPEHVAAKLRYLVNVDFFSILFESSEALRMTIENANATRLRINGRKNQVQKNNAKFSIDHDK